MKYAFSLLTSLLWLTQAAEPPKTIIVIRHAEKLSQDPDSLLSPKGHERAKELARALRDVKVQTIFVSEKQRTQQTAAPIAAQKGLVPIKVSTTQVPQLLEKLNAIPQGQTALVIYHVPIVGQIVLKLGGVTVPAWQEAEFDRMIIITIPAQGKPSVVTLRYGAPS